MNIFYIKIERGLTRQHVFVPSDDLFWGDIYRLPTFIDYDTVGIHDSVRRHRRECIGMRKGEIGGEFALYSSWEVDAESGIVNISAT